jgi:hypothetical protein
MDASTIIATIRQKIERLRPVLTERMHRVCCGHGNHTSSNNTTAPGEFLDLNGLFPNATASSAADIIDATSTVPHRQIVANATVPVHGTAQWRASLLADQLDNGFVSGVKATDLGTLREEAGKGGKKGGKKRTF